MFPPLLSDVGASPAAPWFVTQLLVPFLSVIVGLAGGLMVVRRTAWYQRLTQADPLAQLLWEKRASVYSELSSQIHSVWVTLLGLADATRRSQQPQEEVYDRLVEQVTTLVDLFTKALPVMSQAVQQAVSHYAAHILRTGDKMYREGVIPPNVHEETENIVKDALNVIRSDLQVEALDKQTTTMLEHVLPLSRES